MMNTKIFQMPNRVIFVGDYPFADLMKYQYYNNLQDAINDAEAGFTVISYLPAQTYTPKTDVKIIFIQGNSKSYQGTIEIGLNIGGHPTAVLTQISNDFNSSASVAYDYTVSEIIFAVPVTELNFANFNFFLSPFALDDNGGISPRFVLGGQNGELNMFRMYVLDGNGDRQDLTTGCYFNFEIKVKL